MFIATLSKHLPAVIPSYGSGSLGDCMLEIVHLVEAARYHLYNLDRLTSGEGPAPPDFEPGVDFEGVVLDAHWRIMASLIEFEAFLAVTKRCLDRAWCCLGERLGDGASEVRTLPRAIHNLKNRAKDQGIKKVLHDLEYFAILERAWHEWGQEVANLRNYVEHGASLGGRAFGFTQPVGDNEIIKLFVPDRIPEHKEPTQARIHFHEATDHQCIWSRHNDVPGPARGASHPRRRIAKEDLNYVLEKTEPSGG